MTSMIGVKVLDPSDSYNLGKASFFSDSEAYEDRKPSVQV
jgi:hypothetical protein